MVGRAPHETEVQARPGLESAAPCHQFRVAHRKLPASADATPRRRTGKRHGFNSVRLRLEVVERGGRTDGIAECVVGRHVGDTFAMNRDVASVAQIRDMMLPRLH